MQLDLTNLIATQQVNKTELGRRDNKLPDRTPLPAGEKSFRERVEPEKRINDEKFDHVQINQDNNPTQNFATIAGDIVNFITGEQSNNGQNTVNNVTNIGKPDGSKKLTVGEQLLAGQEGLKQAFDLLKTLKDSGTQTEVGQNPVLALLGLQEVNVDNETNQINLSNSNSNGKLKQQVHTLGNFNELATQALQNKDIANAVQNIEETINTLQNLTDLSKGKEIAPEIIALIEKASAGNNSITEIAGDIIKIAKVKAENPVIAQLDIKSAQTDSLLKGTDKNSNGLNPQTLTNNNEPKINLAALKAEQDVFNAKVQTKNQQSDTDNENVAENKLFQNNNAAANNNAKITSQPQNTNTHSDSNQFRQNASLTAQNDLPQINNPTPAGDFVKFQKYMDNIQNAHNTDGKSNVEKAEKVIAQIKFGMANIAGKNNSNITIQLHPKELGTVDIRMEINSKGETKVAIMAEKTDTLNLLQKEAGTLKEMLSDALQTDSSQLNFSFHEGNTEQWKETINQAFNHSSSRANDMSEPQAPPPWVYQPMIASDGLDIRV